MIGAVAVCVIGGALTFNLTRAKYRLTQSMKLVTGTINYKVPDLRIAAIKTSEDGETYTDVEDVPTSGYTLNEDKSICRVYDGSTTPEEAPKDTNITIEYTEGKVNFLGLGKKNTRCYLYFDKKATSETTLAKLNINSSYIKSGNPDFTKTATGAETVADNGIYKTSDPMYNGESYYWRGAATSNHVIFANKCWRIIRINGDGTIRLIYNGTVRTGNVCTGNGSNAGSIAVAKQAYNVSSGNASYVGWTYKLGYQRPSATSDTTVLEAESNAKIETEKWFNINITGNNLDKVVDGKFCNDRNTQNNEEWKATSSTNFYYAGNQRISTPILDCHPNDVYILKAGAITSDEVIFAGGRPTDNKAYYLYNGQDYMTMTPCVMRGGTEPRMFYINSDGRLYTGDLSVGEVSDPFGIRPVINLRSDVTFNSGSDGTQNNPYIVAS